MLDGKVRGWIDPALRRLGRALAPSVGADAVTLAAFGCGMAASALAALGAFGWALGLMGFSRLLDGLDGAVAAATRRTDRGGYIDIVGDFAFYGAFPFGFAVHDPAQNALPACGLILSFYVNGASFLAFSALAAKRGVTGAARGPKAIYFTTGLAEATETIAVFAAMCLWPEGFWLLAWGFAAVCWVTAGARVALAWRVFG